MTTNIEPIKIWLWDDAPEEYKNLSDHGGDEDGIALLPINLEEPWWLERLWQHCGNDEQRITLPEGTLIIWAH